MKCKNVDTIVIVTGILVIAVVMFVIVVKLMKTLIMDYHLMWSLIDHSGGVDD